MLTPAKPKSFEARRNSFVYKGRTRIMLTCMMSRNAAFTISLVPKSSGQRWHSRWTDAMTHSKPRFLAPTILQTLPELVTPLKRHSWPLSICPPTLSSVTGGAATSIIFVTTKVLSRQKYACHDKSMFVTTKICLSRQNFSRGKGMLVATTVLSWKNYVCRSKHVFVFVATKVLLRQKLCKNYAYGSSRRWVLFLFCFY